tara:strand:+ start:262 stop:570 length:309 start_codon:yes stop_codon:yes gene_type:complete
VFSKIKKYVIGFLVLLGGILVAFLSGKGAGRREEKIGKLDDRLKSVRKELKAKEKFKNGTKKTLTNKKKALEELKKQKNKKVKEVSSDEAADFLKKYSRRKK